MSDAIALNYPFRGRWLVQNSPANRIPSHGTHIFASTYAIDFVPLPTSGRRTAPMTLSSWARPEHPCRFPGFGRPILAPCSGVVTAIQDAEPDHEAFRGLPSVGYALTQRKRLHDGWGALAGNFVIINHGGVHVALCHLQAGSVTVTEGETVDPGRQIGRCGNSGNSTEPHLHIQAIDGPDASQAKGIPVTFNGALPRNGQIVDA